MSKNMNVPKLRFKEFSGEWEEKTIESLVKTDVLDKPIDGNHGNIHPVSSDFVNQGIPFVMANDIKNGKVDLVNCKKIKKEQADSLQKGFSLAGDVLLTHKGSVGQTSLVPKINTDYIMLTPQVTYYRVKNKDSLNNVFLLQTFRSDSFQKTIKMYSDSGTRPYIGITEQRKLKLSIPSKQEQEKIASFLTSVDTKIEQLTRKEELLQQYKKGVMQKIFSQEIRFKADDGSEFPEWEEKKVSDIFDITRGYVLAVTNMSEVKTDEFNYPVYSSQTKNKGLTGYYNQYLYENSITWTTDGANAGDVNFRQGKFYCTNVCGVLKSDKGYANECIAQILNSVTKKYVSYVGNPKLMNNTMGSIKIFIPSSIKEQTKIANFLSSIDSKIEQVQKQLNSTKEFKKALLQQMFV